MITPNLPTKLPLGVLSYWLTKGFLFFLFQLLILLVVVSLDTEGLTNKKTGEVISASAVAQVELWVGLGILALYLFSVLFTIWYFSKYSFVVANDHVSTTSGILIITDKSVQYEEAENASVIRGPLLALFGLAKVKVFTSSPGQLRTVSTKHGTKIVHTPDIDMILLREDAFSLKNRFTSATQRVTVVNSTSTI